MQGFTYLTPAHVESSRAQAEALADETSAETPAPSRGSLSIQSTRAVPRVAVDAFEAALQVATGQTTSQLFIFISKYIKCIQGGKGFLTSDFTLTCVCITVKG